MEYVSVLYEDAVEIWDFYGGKIPLLSNQKFNKHLKNLSKNAKIDKNVSTLTARHTYGTYLIQKGLPFDIVSKMLGHTSTKQTKTYAALLDETILRANQGIKNSGIGSTTPKTFNAPRIKKSGQSGQDWDDTLEWFRENLGLD